ncbi:hypothetical protein Taro_055789 [Colocasia esculenta]|uniref:Uncharacterized protein n=1 Tax=Colocasia esculenta TaxID=4460 RepID=A0A843XUF2_COLES|nr:hypothetical protein [Colocasia esculenta]
MLARDGSKRSRSDTQGASHAAGPLEDLLRVVVVKQLLRGRYLSLSLDESDQSAGRAILRGHRAAIGLKPKKDPHQKEGYLGLGPLPPQPSKGVLLKPLFPDSRGGSEQEAERVSKRSLGRLGVFLEQREEASVVVSSEKGLGNSFKKKGVRKREGSERQPSTSPAVQPSSPHSGTHRSDFLYHERPPFRSPSMWKGHRSGPPFRCPLLWKATVQVSFTMGAHRSDFLHCGRSPFKFSSPWEATVQDYDVFRSWHIPVLSSTTREPVPCTVVSLPSASTLLLAPSPS